MMQRLGELTFERRAMAFSLANLVVQQWEGGLRAGSNEYEICKRTADIAGVPFDSSRVRVPWALMAPNSWRRDLNATTSSAGGYLIETLVGDTSAFARAFRLSRLGAQIISGLQGNVNFPRVATSSAFGWLTNETSQITPSDQVFGAIAGTPHNGGVITNYSRKLNLQAAGVEDILRADLLGEVGRGLDTAAVAGDGSAGAPVGLLNLSGVQSVSGTSLAWAGILSMQKKAADSNVDETTDAWLGATDVRALLAARERVSGNGAFIWDNNRIAGLPAFASSVVSAGSLLVGDWSRVVVCLWGPGPELIVTPFADRDSFMKGIVSMRVMVSCDILVRQPGCFVKSTSIT